MRYNVCRTRSLGSLLFLLCMAASRHAPFATAVVARAKQNGNDNPHDHESTETDVQNFIYNADPAETDESAMDRAVANDPYSTSQQLPPRTDNESGLIINGRNDNSNVNITFGTTTTKDGNSEDDLPPPSRWTGLDTIVAIFFVVAGLWLIAATAYSIMLIVLIRLQARGELDIYDENLGLWTFCGGRYSLHFGCIVRRYAIQLERDYQRRLHRRYAEGQDGENVEDPFEPAPIRIMTREERRQAVEELLGIQPGKSLETWDTARTEENDDLDSTNVGEECDNDATL